MCKIKKKRSYRWSDVKNMIFGTIKYHPIKCIFQSDDTKLNQEKRLRNEKKVWNELRRLEKLLMQGRFFIKTFSFGMPYHYKQLDILR